MHVTITVFLGEMPCSLVDQY